MDFYTKDVMHIQFAVYDVWKAYKPSKMGQNLKCLYIPNNLFETAYFFIKLPFFHTVLLLQQLKFQN